MKLKIVSILFFGVSMACTSSGPDTSQINADLPVQPLVESSSLIKNLKAEFKKRNPRIEVVKVVDTKPSVFGKEKYFVLAHGIRGDRNFSNDFNDELFILFSFDESLETIEQVIDVIPTPRWNDYEFRITRVDADSVTLGGKGMTYGDNEIRKKYDLSR